MTVDALLSCQTCYIPTQAARQAPGLALEEDSLGMAVSVASTGAAPQIPLPHPRALNRQRADTGCLWPVGRGGWSILPVRIAAGDFGRHLLQGGEGLARQVRPARSDCPVPDFGGRDRIPGNQASSWQCQERGIRRGLGRSGHHPGRLRHHDAVVPAFAERKALLSRVAYSAAPPFST